MNLILSKKVYTPLLTLALLGSLFAQQNSNLEPLGSHQVFVHPETKDDILMNLIETRDTSSLYYFSFEHQRTVKFKEFLNDASFSFITSCLGGNLILTAPDYGADASYEWAGPNGYEKQTADINITNVQFSNAGIYSVVVSKGDLTVYGKIKLLVKDSPIVMVDETGFIEGKVIHLRANDAGKDVGYIWKNADNKIVSKSMDLWLPEHQPGNYVYHLTVNKNGCKVHRAINVAVNSRRKDGQSKSILEAMRE